MNNQNSAGGDYAPYIGKVKRINILTLAAYVCSLLAIVCFIFMPIYKAEVDVNTDLYVNYIFGKDIEDVDERDIENFMENELKNMDADTVDAIMNGGDAEVEFSAFTDFIIMIKSLTSGNFGAEAMLAFSDGLFVIFEVLFSIIFLVLTIKQTYNLYLNIKEPSNGAMLTYNQIVKTGDVNSSKKKNLFGQQFLISFLIYAFFDVIFARVVAGFYDSIGYESERYMSGFCGLSSFSIFPIILFIIYLFVNGMRKKEEREMLLSITKQQYK